MHQKQVKNQQIWWVSNGKAGRFEKNAAGEISECRNLAAKCMSASIGWSTKGNQDFEEINRLWSDIMAEKVRNINTVMFAWRKNKSLF